MCVCLHVAEVLKQTDRKKYTHFTPMTNFSSLCFQYFLGVHMLSGIALNVNKPERLF